MAGTEKKRITELTEASTIQSGDFIAVDSIARGTKKVSTDTLATSAALTAEVTARAGADEQMSERMDGIEEQTALIQNPTKTLSGALVSFADGADMPMVACTAEITPKQSGTGTPAPDNVRQISGWESVNVYKSGKNVCYEAQTGYLSLASDYVVYNSSSGTTLHFNCKAGQTYVVSGVDINRAVWGVFDSEPASGTRTNDFLSFYSSQRPLTFTPTKSGVCLLYVNNGTVDTSTAQIELGSTATAYEPHTGTTTTVNLGRTVYGGTLDVVSGLLTVDMKYDQMTYAFLSSLTSGYIGYSANITQVGGNAVWVRNWNYTDYPANIDGGIKAVCNAFPISMHNKNIFSSQYRTFFGVGDMTSVEEFLTAVQTLESNGGGLWIAHELATPQTYQLTPTEVNTLLGENNVWADSGDVEITYRRDISIVLENLENALNGSNSLNTMMMSAPTENTAEEPTGDEAENDMR